MQYSIVVLGDCVAQRLVIPCTPTSQELMEQKRQRQLKKQELGRRRSAASQNRMRIISQLAEDSSGSAAIISDRPFLLCCGSGVAGMFICVCSCREEIFKAEGGHVWDER